MNNIPFGNCFCGCGQKAPLHKQTISNIGISKGDPYRFIKGHYKKEIQFATCHPDRPIKAKGLCASCYNIANSNRTPEVREATIKRQKEYARLHPETPEKNRARQLKSKYGISIEEYNNLLVSQNNGCAICGKKTAYNNGTKRLHVDHCHNTNKIRGLLCSQCNTTLGHLEKIGIARVMEYLND